ncbi:MAG: 3-keto-disaccharide hydrolase [Novosphingobium sp.]|uniref:3-keto-disaccharide hydrolase n=1 Tax=Novosphingobium sp. TaxID=1874826 RepID=UPI003B9D390E
MTTTRRDALSMLAMTSLAATAMPAAAKVAASAIPDAGWKPLFNGKDLSGWTFFQDGVGDRDRDGAVAVEHGMLHILGPRYHGPAAAGMGYLATAQEYENYHLSLEYRWGPRRYEPRLNWKRDSGILYHVAPGREFLWPDCVEYQIMEHSTGDAIPVNHRAIQAISMGGLPAWPNNFAFNNQYAPQINAGSNLRQMIKAEGVFDNLDGWNTVELIAKGDSAAHIVNGRLITALYGLQSQDSADRSHYVRLSKGRILLQIECAEIMFRNVKIRSL